METSDKTARQLFEEVRRNPTRKRFGFGRKPALINVDLQKAYTAVGEPNNRAGAYEFFATGMHSSGEKMGLVAFDLGAIPEDATVQSAALSVSMQWQATSGIVDVHAVTAPWSEATVTYTSLGGAFDPAVEASFAAPAGNSRCASGPR